MARQERIFDGVPHIRVADAGRMLAPLNPREARRLMKEQGLWPIAVRSAEGLSPDSCHENTELWVEKKEAENLKRLVVGNKNEGED